MSYPAPTSPAEHYLMAEQDMAAAYVAEPEMAVFLLRRGLIHAQLAAVDDETHRIAREIATWKDGSE